MSKIRPGRFPQCCVAVAVGILFGLVALTLGLVACVHFSARPMFVPSVLPSIEQSVGWHLPIQATTTQSEPVTMLFVGDIMLDRNVATRSQAAHDLSYPFKRLPTDWFRQFDYTIGNLEGPVTDKRRPPEKSIDFQFDPAVIPMLQAQGIKAFSQANNHSLDQGHIGADDSRARIQVAGFLTFGAQVDDGDIALATTTVKGQRFAFVGFNTTDNPLDLEAASSTLAQARAQADHVIVFMHWGLEYKDHPPQFVVDQAHWLIDHGVDIVIGGHPHWVQGIDEYKGKPIVYSLGNFIFDQDFSLETRQGLAVHLTFNDKKISIEPIPLQIDLSQPRMLEGEAKMMALKHLSDISSDSLREQVKNGLVKFE